MLIWHSSRGPTDPGSLRSTRRSRSFTTTLPSLSRTADSREFRPRQARDSGSPMMLGVPDLTVWFHPPRGWADTIHVHVWDTHPRKAATGWPGVPMHTHGDGWYVYRIEGVDTASLVVHDQHGRQTAALRGERGGWMDRDGQWQDADPRTAGTAAASGTAPAATGAPAPQPPPSGVDFRAETIYFLLT